MRSYFRMKHAKRQLTDTTHNLLNKEKYFALDQFNRIVMEPFLKCIELNSGLRIIESILKAVSATANRFIDYNPRYNTA